MSNLNIPSLSLSSGTTIPQLGLGVFLLPPAETTALVGQALEAGYRHIDTARIYDNEAEVGKAVAESGIARDELFITTKLWNDDQTRAAEAFDASLDRLGLDYVDLYLIHWPVPSQGNALTAWQELIKIKESGRARAIGVSNFEIPHLTQLIDETGVVPAVNQIEMHPLHQRRELREFCLEKGIVLEAWGPLAQGKSNLLELPAITTAAAAHGKTPAQVVLRWHIQRDTVIFPKTSKAQRLRENAALFDFALTADEMAAIDALDEQHNFGPDPFTFGA